MTTIELTTILGNLNQGDAIPGTIAGKSYIFIGIEKYPGRGRYANLKGQDVIVPMSNERKRSRIVLFLDNLLLFVNATPSELRYGYLPKEYMKLFRGGKKPIIPNLYEYETHYKSLARHLQGLYKPQD
ncbi:MAG TPA: hypothetical protein VIK19_07705 [Syntrophales bacterium]